MNTKNETSDFVQVETEGGDLLTGVKNSDLGVELYESFLHIGVFEFGSVTLESYPFSRVFVGVTVMTTLSPSQVYDVYLDDEFKYTVVADEDGVVSVNTEGFECGELTFEKNNRVFESVTVTESCCVDDSSVTSRIYGEVISESINVQEFVSSEAVELYYSDDVSEFLKAKINEYAYLEPQNTNTNTI